MTEETVLTAASHQHERVRRGDGHDAGVLLALFDDAVRWQVQRGFDSQWGAVPFSELPRRVEAVRRWATVGELWICERDGRPAAALVLGDATPYVPPADRPEVYVVVLVGSHEPFARGAGARLLEFAASRARHRGAEQLRVDCYAGNGGALVRFYERCGFHRSGTFAVDGWPGQVLVKPLD